MVGNRRHISNDIKHLVYRMSKNTELTQADIRRYTGVSERAQQRINQNMRTVNNVVKVPFERGRPRLLNSLEATFLEGCVERQPDMTTDELQIQLYERCNVLASTQTITRTLRRRGYTRKKVTRPAAEQNADDVAAYMMLIGTHFRPEQLVFVDESATDRRSARRAYAWAPCGNRARRRDFFIRGRRYSILPALSLDGILHLDVLDHSYTSETFSHFIEGLLDNMNPFPQKNSVLVMDNATIHKSDELRALVEGRGMRLVFLPSYSPHLNPIEEAFSSIKAWLRCNRDFVLGELSGAPGADPYAMLWEAVFTVTPEKALGWFRHSGYVL